MESGIYCFENKVNGMMYIGKAVNIERRINAHLTYLRRNKDSSTYLQNAWNKYGEGCFEWYTIKNYPIEKIEEKEKYYIKKLNTKRPNGYNLTDGGDGTLGYEISEEERAKRVVRGKNQNHPRGKDAPMWGKKHSQETIEKMRNKPKIFGESHNNFGKKTGKNSYYYNVRKIKVRNFIYWQAAMKIKGKSKFIGSYKTQLLAAMGFDKFIILNDLPNPTNFPKFLYSLNFYFIFFILDLFFRIKND